MLDVGDLDAVAGELGAGGVDVLCPRRRVACPWSCRDLRAAGRPRPPGTTTSSSTPPAWCSWRTRRRRSPTWPRKPASESACYTAAVRARRGCCASSRATASRATEPGAGAASRRHVRAYRVTRAARRRGERACDRTSRSHTGGWRSARRRHPCRRRADPRDDHVRRPPRPRPRPGPAPPLLVARPPGAEPAWEETSK